MTERSTLSPTVYGLPAQLGPLPAFRLIEQRFSVPAAVDAIAAVDSQWSALPAALGRRPGSEIAVAVGSRGIARIDEIVRTVIENLKRAGHHPFIVPAMGSHGGGTAEGQAAVLASLGITEELVGAPIRASMDTVQVGAAEGVPLHVDRLAAAADGIVLINRVKPHTDFAGPLGSGLMKMLCVGLGKQLGADTCHRATMIRDLGELVMACGRELLRILPVCAGVAVVENQVHEVCDVRVVPAEDIVSTDVRLQTEARGLLPGLPLDDIDLLIVDEMGKDVSGAGMDPNVTGRTVGARSIRRSRPRIGRIFARALTPGSHGNACGLGYIDIATPRLVEAIDMEATALNAFTACAPEDARLPLTVPTEREAIAAALATVRPHTLEDVRIVHIRNTSTVARLLVSEGCLAALAAGADVAVGEQRLLLDFDSQGDLISPLGGQDGAA
ncbi:MAG: lactate racemase domain-containing protein [Actinomycetes bacterium]